MGDRGVSTVLDVALALLLISAAMVVLAIYLGGDDGGIDPLESSRTAETIAGSTISIQYSVQAAESSFHDPDEVGGASFDRTVYGPATTLLARAAVTNATVDGDRPLEYADDFVEAVDASVMSALVGANNRFYATATWIPYADASIRGRANAGARPPVDEDVATTTMTVSSGFDVVDPDEMASAYVDEYTSTSGGDHGEAMERASAVVARSIVDGYFDGTATQYDLERLGLARELRVYHVERFGEAVGAGGLDPGGGPLSRGESDASAVKEELVAGLAPVIAEDLQSSAPADEIERLPINHGNEGEISRHFDDLVAVEDVTITVQTWHP